MNIIIDYPISQTYILALIITITILLTIKKANRPFFSLETTDELKGFAILSIIFGHIGYFLANNPAFLYPLSTISGVGVNLFLFLSGYGLTYSMINKPQTVFNFYRNRISKIYFPLWVSLIMLILANFFILNISYNPTTVIQAFLGYFPTADLFSDINSPLWFITFIIIYYLLFPIIFLKKYPFISVALMTTISFIIFYYLFPNNMTFFQNLDFIDLNTAKLYRLHFLAFPLGMLLAISINKYSLYVQRFRLLTTLRLLIIGISIYFLGYFAINSGVGGSVLHEETLSLLTIFFIMMIFLLKKIQIGFFALFGTLSYEIYLIHWPILSNYNFLYNLIPSAYATVLYLVIFLLLALLIQKISGYLLNLWHI